MATWPDPMFGIPIGMRNGLIRSGPRRALIAKPSMSVPTPPSPVPRITPVRSARSPSNRSGQPGLVERLARRDQPELDVAVGAAQLLAVEDAAGIEVVDLAGDLRVSRDGSNASIVRTPDSAGDEALPRSWRTSLPSAVTMPMPVTTTRRRPIGHRTSFPVRTVAAR